MADREDNRRDQRVSAARRSIREAVDRDQTRAALRAAGARSVDDAAVEAVSVLAEERLAEIVARAVESSQERRESRLSASAVAVAAQREAEGRSRRRAER
jgi:hypothetical protein